MNRKVDLGDPLPLPYQPKTTTTTNTTSPSFESVRPIKLERKQTTPITLKVRNRIRLDIRHDHQDIELLPDTSSKDNYISVINNIKRLLTQLDQDQFKVNINVISHELDDILIKLNDDSNIEDLEVDILRKQQQLMQMRENHDDSNNSDSDISHHNIFDEIDRLQKLNKSKQWVKIGFVVATLLLFMISGLLVSDLKYDYCYYFC